ncbi:MAG: hypothetical protein IKU72_05465 [Oscillospiraceae bacterium]|nr:hypothetical protein [Oscillospiraceae bacterium]
MPQENIFQFDRIPKVEYRVKEHIKWFAGAQSYVTYGMEAVSEKELVFSVPELSVDYEKVKKFVQLCNVHNASPTHIEDLIEDYFYIG